MRQFYNFLAIFIPKMENFTPFYYLLTTLSDVFNSILIDYFRRYELFCVTLRVN